MAIYNKFPRLYQNTDGGQAPINPQLNYYSGLNKSTPLSNFQANQTRAKNTPTNRDPYGIVGNNYTRQFSNGPGNGLGTAQDQFNALPENVRRYLTLQSQYADEAGNETFRTNWSPEAQTLLNGRVQAGDPTQNNLLIDPNAVEYDDTFGYLTHPSNIREDNSGLFRYGPLGNILLGSSLVLGGGMLANSFLPAAAGGAVPDLSMVGAGSGVGTGGGTGMTLADYGMAADFAGTAAEAGAPLSVNVPGTMSALPGYTAPSMLPAPTAQTAGMPLWARAGGQLVSGFLGMRESDRNSAAQREAAERADPFGPYRDQYAQRINSLYQDPNYLENLPGYRFSRDQGEQGVERQAARRGYFRSPNMLFDLSKFNQGLAQQYYNQELQNLMQLAGVGINPGNSANILSNSANRDSSMRAGSFNEIIGAGIDIWDWLTGGG